MYTELNENEMKNLPIIANVVIKVVLSVIDFMFIFK